MAEEGFIRRMTLEELEAIESQRDSYYVTVRILNPRLAHVINTLEEHSPEVAITRISVRMDHIEPYKRETIPFMEYIPMQVDIWLHVDARVPIPDYDAFKTDFRILMDRKPFIAKALYVDHLRVVDLETGNQAELDRPIKAKPADALHDMMIKSGVGVGGRDLFKPLEVCALYYNDGIGRAVFRRDTDAFGRPRIVPEPIQASFVHQKLPNLRLLEYPEQAHPSETGAVVVVCPLRTTKRMMSVDGCYFITAPS